MTGQEEPCAICDADGELTGEVRPRGEVHRLGLWHRAAHVFVVCPEGCLLVQQRAADKDVCPGLWDYSIGEHLKPEESWRDGALRGLAEELGIAGGAEVRLEPLAGPASFVLKTDALIDREWQQGFVWRCPQRPVPQFKDGEVSAVRWMTRTQIDASLAGSPAQWTPWFAHAYASSASVLFGRPAHPYGQASSARL